ncbi:MAG TPA: ATP-binding domain-containing protein [Nocardioidaceae bacterium]|nr:ATP-binding domain-containing protein [Nocardioidaceae bacterium]
MPTTPDRAPACPEPSPPEPTGELVAERRHLAESRAALHRMRERTAAMEALSGDRVSGEYLKLTLYRRMKALEDDPEVPLFFGRLQYDDQDERFYIGRRHVSDERGDPLVVDWRAPVSRAFYRATAAEPMGVRQRRRFGFQHGALSAYEDEDLKRGAMAARGAERTILEEEIERPRTGPMRDIVATIQPEQDDIVRADLATSVCVQGAPGTGKTAVGLHRAAYLLYANRDQLARQGVLVVGPNASFLRYIADVLPALGEIDAKQTTIEQLVQSVPVRGVDDVAVARLKSDARMAEVLRRAVWSSVGSAVEALVVPIGARRWRVPAFEADEIVDELRHRGVRYDAGRAMLPQRLAHAVLVKMELAGESPDDRVQDWVARCRPVKAFAAAVWPPIEPRRLVWRLLSDPEFLAAAAEGLLTPAEQATLRWAPAPRSPGAAHWSMHDAVLLDEAADLVERLPSLGHVVLDEAQDLSPMMLRAVGRRCSTGSATVLGDLAQATTPWAVRDWPRALGHLGKAGAHLEELTLGFRVPADVIDFAARLLPVIAPALAVPTSVRRAAGDLVVRPSADPVAAAVTAAAELSRREGSVALIVSDSLLAQTDRALSTAGLAHGRLSAAAEPAPSSGPAAEPAPGAAGDADWLEARVDVVPASLAKGLEFDHVVVVEPEAIVAAEPDRLTGLRRLYVCLTRAVMSLTVLHSGPLPPEL